MDLGLGLRLSRSETTSRRRRYSTTIETTRRRGSRHGTGHRARSRSRTLVETGRCRGGRMTRLCNGSIAGRTSRTNSTNSADTITVVILSGAVLFDLHTDFHRNAVELLSILEGWNAHGDAIGRNACTADLLGSFVGVRVVDTIKDHTTGIGSVDHFELQIHTHTVATRGRFDIRVNDHGFVPADGNGGKLFFCRNVSGVEREQSHYWPPMIFVMMFVRSGDSYASKAPDRSLAVYWRSLVVWM